MLSIFPSNKKCRLEHVVNKLMSCLINEFLWILIQTAGNKYQTSLIPHATSWNSIDTPRNCMEFHGMPWILHGTLWKSMNFRGVPWNVMEVFHMGARDFPGP